MSNVLPFKRLTKQADAVSVELHVLLDVYDRLISLLRNTDGDGLDLLADAMVRTVVHCRESLLKGLDEGEGEMLVKEMRTGLREMPQTLRAMFPGLGPRLGESFQHKLGVQFTSY
ncbi:MAG TPA: hypothetical protein VL550_05425 [Rhodocyclaceae bacterium]|jgi:hypothetical protein|nr:hypothetical protein [Rhodocyclaceae bacterium]